MKNHRVQCFFGAKEGVIMPSNGEKKKSEDMVVQGPKITDTVATPLEAAAEPVADEQSND